MISAFYFLLFLLGVALTGPSYAYQYQSFSFSQSKKLLTDHSLFFVEITGYELSTEVSSSSTSKFSKMVKENSLSLQSFDEIVNVRKQVYEINPTWVYGLTKSWSLGMRVPLRSIKYSYQAKEDKKSQVVFEKFQSKGFKEKIYNQGYEFIGTSRDNFEIGNITFFQKFLFDKANIYLTPQIVFPVNSELNSNVVFFNNFLSDRFQFNVGLGWDKTLGSSFRFALEGMVKFLDSYSGRRNFIQSGEVTRGKINVDNGFVQEILAFLEWKAAEGFISYIATSYESGKLGKTSIVFPGISMALKEQSHQFYSSEFGFKYKLDLKKQLDGTRSSLWAGISYKKGAFNKSSLPFEQSKLTLGSSY